MNQPKEKNESVENVYRLDGRVPVGRAIPFGMQHILAMFVSNLAPILLVCAVAIVGGKEGYFGTHPSEQAQLLQCAMFTAGIGTIVQLYPLWKIGAKLPLVLGCGFTFLTALTTVASTPGWGYESMLGAVIVGGLLEGVLGLTAKYWRKLIAPIVSACVVTAIGMSLFKVGMESFGGGSASVSLGTFGSKYQIFVASLTLLACLLWKYLAKSVWKNLNVLCGLVVGYGVSVLLTLTGRAELINFANMKETVAQLGIINIPTPVFLRHMPEFHIGAIITVGIMFLVSMTEGIGDMTAVCKMGIGRDITPEEVQGGLAADGVASFLSGVFGGCPVTTFSQNVGLVATTKVINRFTILMGALALLLASIFPPIGAFFSSLPYAVIGGCTIMVFGSIIFSGIRMIAECGFSDRNLMIVSLSFCVGIGVSQVDSSIFSFISEGLMLIPNFSQEVATSIQEQFVNIFGSNSVSGVFVVSLLLSFLLPKEKEEKQENTVVQEMAS